MVSYETFAPLDTQPALPTAKCGCRRAVRGRATLPVEATGFQSPTLNTGLTLVPVLAIGVLLSRQLSAVDNELTIANTKATALDGEFNGFEKKLNKRFDALDRRLDLLEGKFDSLLLAIGSSNL